MEGAGERLFAAIQAGDVAAVEALVRAEPALAAVRNPQGVSAVTWSCYLRQDGARAALLAARPALDVFDAIAVGDGPRADALLDADPALARAWSADGFTPLHLAAFFARVEMARRLLALGADPNARGRGMPVTPLHSAAAAHARDIVRLLLDAGGDANARQVQGLTALMEAAQSGDEAMADALLAHGAQSALAADDGRTAADFAAARGHHALAGRLRAGGPAAAAAS